MVNLTACVGELTGVTYRFVSFLSKLFLFGCILLNLPALIRRVDGKIFAIGMIFLTVCSGNLLFFPEISSYFISSVVSFCTTAFPVLLFVYIVKDAKQMQRNLLLVSRVIFLITLPVVVLLLARNTGAVFNEGNYSMGFGYACALPAIFLLMNFIEKRSIVDLLGTVVMLVTIFAFGSRGPLLSVLFFFALFCFRFLISRREYAILIVTVILIIPICFFFEDLLELLSVFLEQYGIESRTLDLLQQEELYTSGRDKLYPKLLAIILEDPLTVRGICAEWSVIGVYAHNIVLELVYQFGIIGGGCLVLIIFCCAISSFFFTPMNEDGILELIFACMSLTHLMFSSSLWTNYTFWAWIALFLRKRTMLKHKN